MRRLTATLLAVAALGTAPSIASATAPMPGSVSGTAVAPIVGSWQWSDADEALVNSRNPRVLTVRVAKGRAYSARFGRGRWVKLVWRPGTKRFTFTATRRVGPNGERRAKVRYSGRVTARGTVLNASGTLRIRSSAYKGVSGFTATRSR